MKSQFVALAIILAGLPALAFGQSCSCGVPSGRVYRPAGYSAWSDYQPAGDSGGCGGCSRCCDPCCRPLLCIIPNTVKKIGCALDCLRPCGPRSCGMSCTSNVGCAAPITYSPSCSSCTSGVPAMDPFQDDHLVPPTPPKPTTHETRYQKSVMAPRPLASKPASKAATKSIMTRSVKISDADEGEFVSQAQHEAPVRRASADVPVTARQSSSIPHNPLR